MIDEHVHGFDDHHPYCAWLEDDHPLKAVANQVLDCVADRLYHHPALLSILCESSFLHYSL
jgi:hypothetical protein